MSDQTTRREIDEILEHLEEQTAEMKRMLHERRVARRTHLRVVPS